MAILGDLFILGYLFGQSVCRDFYIFNVLKIIWKLCISWLVILISSQCFFKIGTTQLIFYANSLVALYMNMTFFKKLFSEYFSLNSLVVLILSWCFNEVMRIKICIYWHSGYWHCRWCSNQWKHSEVVNNSNIDFFIGAL